VTDIHKAERLEALLLEVSEHRTELRRALRMAETYVEPTQATRLQEISRAVAHSLDRALRLMRRQRDKNSVQRGLDL
jgi:hypothetical protein